MDKSTLKFQSPWSRAGRNHDILLWMKKGLFVICILAIFTPIAAVASPHPGLIVPDTALQNTDAMSRSEIQRFLDRQGAGIARMRFKDADGRARSAADIIWRAAEDQKISARLILTLLQREQSLVTDPRPTQDQLDWAMGYAVCDSCAKRDRAIQKFKGFATQVRSAVKRIRELDNLPVGNTRKIDGQLVTPLNKVTAILYTYTPHLTGNLNAATLWKKWFTRARFIQNYSVVRDPEGKLWLFSDGELKQIPDKQAFRALGYNPDEVMNVSFDDIASYPRGSPL